MKNPCAFGRSAACVVSFFAIACGSGKQHLEQGRVTISGQLVNADSVNYHGSIQGISGTSWVNTATFTGSTQGMLSYVSACEDRLAPGANDARVVLTVDSVVIGGATRAVSEGSGTATAEFDCRAGADARVDLTVSVDIGATEKGFADIVVVFEVVGAGNSLKCDCAPSFFTGSDAMICAFATQPQSAAFIRSNLFMWRIDPGNYPSGPPQFFSGSMSDGSYFNAAALPIGTIEIGPSLQITTWATPLTLAGGVHHATSGTISMIRTFLSTWGAASCTGIGCCSPKPPTPNSFPILYAHVESNTHLALIVYAHDEVFAPGAEIHQEFAVVSADAKTDGSVTQLFTRVAFQNLNGRMLRACGADTTSFDATTTGPGTGRVRCTGLPASQGTGSYNCSELGWFESSCLDN